MSRSIFHCIDAHTCGNPVRVVKEGGPVLNGETMAEKRLDFLAHHDWIRKGLMFEPRGHDMMSGSILYPPHDPANDAAILFIETSGCLPMCGHGTIGTITVAIEQGLIMPKEPGIVRLEAPAGLILVSYDQLPSGKVRSVRLTNVPSFLAAAGLEIDAPGLGPIRVDIAYGGNFYAIIDPQEHYTDLADYALSDLIAWSPELRRRRMIDTPWSIPSGRTSGASAISCGPGSRLYKGRQPGMRSSTGRRPSTDHLAGPERRPGWPSGPPWENCIPMSPLSMNRSLAACSPVGSSS